MILNTACSKTTQNVHTVLLLDCSTCHSFSSK